MLPATGSTMMQAISAPHRSKAAVVATRSF